MTETHTNPYREGDSKELFAYMMEKETFTRADLIAFTRVCMGKSRQAALAKVQTLISPRKSSKRGDCRGQVSAQGHLYYVSKIPRKVRYGIKEPQRFQLNWRLKPLERKYRTPPVRVHEVAQEKTGMVAQVRALKRKLERLNKEIASIKSR